MPLTHEQRCANLVKARAARKAKAEARRAAKLTAIASAVESQVAQTTEEIEAKLELRFNTLIKMTKAAAKNRIPSMIVSGPAGLGKTYEIEKALGETGIDFTFAKGHVSPFGLYQLLYNNHRHGSVLVMDDADSVFDNEITLNLLKGATDSTDKRMIGWHSSAAEKMDLPDEFEFRGTIIFITNIDFDAVINKGGKLSPHFEALVSRSHYLDLGMKTKKDYMVRIHQVVKRSDILTSRGLYGDQEKELLDFIDTNQDNLRELSLRMVVKLAGLMGFDREGWRDIAKVTLMRGVS